MKRKIILSIMQMKTVRYSQEKSELPKVTQLVRKGFETECQTRNATLLPPHMPAFKWQLFSRF